jgi:phage/plasmid-like protein (TIGR03299 family)
MAHELEFKNGRASMFSVGETPWHREGVILAEAPTFAEALKLGRLDYEVEKRDTFRQVGEHADGSPRFAKNDSAYVTVRTDTEQELGTVGRDYVCMQNLDAFRVLEPLVDEGVAKIETGGVLRDGADAWLLTRWDLAKFGPVVREIFADEVIPYGLLANNHSGRRGILLQDTNIRVVCANTLGFAESAAAERRIMIRHSGQAKTQLVDAAHQMWGGIIERYETLALQYRTLRATMLSEEQFAAAVLDVIAPDPRKDPKFNPDAKLAELVVDRADRKRAEGRRLWTEGKGHTGEHNGWYAYNAAVELLDHNRELYPTRNGSWRTASLIDGQLKTMKDKVLSNVLKLATV